MSAFVVDTGVLIVANGRAEGVSPECVVVCVDALEEVQKTGILALDDGLRIFQEYQNHCSFSGQPGVGDAFFKWVFNNLYNDQVCELVLLAPDPERTFEEFPDDPALSTFDPSDRKFVATALASRNEPKLLVVVDSDWWDHRKVLQANGVKIEFLCPEYFIQREKAHGRKQPRPRRKSS